MQRVVNMTKELLLRHFISSFTIFWWSGVGVGCMPSLFGCPRHTASPGLASVFDTVLESPGLTEGTYVIHCRCLSYVLCVMIYAQYSLSKIKQFDSITQLPRVWREDSWACAEIVSTCVRRSLRAMMLYTLSLSILSMLQSSRHTVGPCRGWGRWWGVGAGHFNQGCVDGPFAFGAQQVWRIVVANSVVIKVNV